ncbi:sodium-dependent bicarbonate transport family permease, partial [Acinetobacter baumannii]
IPIFHGFLGALLGHWAGLTLGGCTVFAAIVSSASYIAAPPAVRLTLPTANPTLSMTAALAITFPFKIAFGIPLDYWFAQHLGAIDTPLKDTTSQ